MGVDIMILNNSDVILKARFVAYMKRVMIYGLYRFSKTKKNTRIFSNNVFDDNEKLENDMSMKYYMEHKLGVETLVEQAFDTLNALEKEILILRYKDEMPDIEISQQLGYSRSYVNKVRLQTLQKLRMILEDR